jgi:hypothetical protein
VHDDSLAIGLAVSERTKFALQNRYQAGAMAGRAATVGRGASSRGQESYLNRAPGKRKMSCLVNGVGAKEI